MRFNQVQISRVDNGFIVQSQKQVWGETKPEMETKVFHQFEEVMHYLFPKSPQFDKQREEEAPAVQLAM